MMDTYSSLAAWMTAGALNSTDPARERNLVHLRALKEAHATAAGSSAGSSAVRFGRFSAALMAIRPAAAQVDPACCPA